MTTMVSFETEYGNKVTFDMVEGKPRICYWTTDGLDFDVIMVPDSAIPHLKVWLDYCNKVNP